MRKYYIFSVIVTIIIVLTAGLLFSKGLNPKEAKNRDLDNLQSNNISGLYSQLDYLYAEKGLPDNLGVVDVAKTLKYDAVTNKLFDYNRLTEYSYELCANFKTDTRPTVENSSGNYNRLIANYENPNPKDYYNIPRIHPKGYHCMTFELTPRTPNVLLPELPIQTAQ